MGAVAKSKHVVIVSQLKPEETRKSYLWDEILKGIHDFGAFGLLVVGEATSDDDDSREHNT